MQNLIAACVVAVWVLSACESRTVIDQLSTPLGACDTDAMATDGAGDGAPDAAVEAAADVSVEAAVDAGADLNAVCAIGNNGGGCTATEARFAPRGANCYGCMVGAASLDDVVYADMGHECEDLVGVAAGGSMAGVSRAQLCFDTIDCVMAAGCEDSIATAAEGCYCGTLTDNQCGINAHPAMANGACAAIEIAATEHKSTDAPSSVVPDFFDPNLGGGMANLIFYNAISAGCAAACGF